MELPLILASRSPRRKELLTEAGLPFQIVLPDEEAEDERRNDESPEHFVCRLAVQKARNVAAKISSGRIIACDTIVVCRNTILGKPCDRTDAERMLRLLRGTRHFVLSGLCLLIKPMTASPTSDEMETCSVCCEQTELSMLPITDRELSDYLDGNAWLGKAGAFGYQDRNAWISIVKGSESNVVGLPMERLKAMLETT